MSKFNFVIFTNILLKSYHILEQSQHSLTPAAQNAPSTVPPPEGDASGCSDVDMRFYNEMMGHIPDESVNIGTILHCIVQQVYHFDQ